MIHHGLDRLNKKKKKKLHQKRLMFPGLTHTHTHLLREYLASGFSFKILYRESSIRAKNYDKNVQCH